MTAFVVTVFLGAFLIFQVQPILGRYILPWFGGGPGVWTTCLLFFQVALLAGYAYAHLLATRLKPLHQAVVHTIVLAGSALMLPIAPDELVWKTAVEGDPTGRIMLLLIVAAGLPYVALSATAPLLHGWFHRGYPQRSAYRLYAVSNAGSLLALVSYPFVVEPLLRVSRQTTVWSWAYVGFAGLCAWCAFDATRRVEAEPETEVAKETGTPQAIEGARPWAWLGLAATGSALLVATTNQMSQEVAVVPFLWVLPLTVYLVTFILAFESDRWYRRRTSSFALAAAVPAAAVAVAAGGLLPLELQTALYAFALLTGCMVCHGELAAIKPPAADATGFYLYVAAGGALGGAFVAVPAPRLFPDYWEYPLALGACCLLLLGAWVSRGWRPNPQRPASLLSPPPALAVALLALGYASAAGGDANTIETERNFYGVLRLSETADAAGRQRVLTHGRTEHGTQFLDSARRRVPTTYFGAGSGIESAFVRHPRRLAGESLSIGVIGLGAGTLAAYGQAGDAIRFFEINPQVVAAAQERFSYLSDSAAEVAIVLGDARIQLEAERAREFDLFAVDAFTSGAIPIHLLTAEAAEVYAQRLTENGILAFHITNRFLDLTPVVRGLARHLGMNALRVNSKGDDEAGLNASTWMLLTRDNRFLNDPEVRARATEPDGNVVEWTDDYSGLWQALR